MEKRRAIFTQPPKFYKNPNMAVISSLFIPGLGQIYNGQFIKGFIFLISWPISIASIIFIADYIHVILWGSHIYDAYSLIGSITFIIDTIRDCVFPFSLVTPCSIDKVLILIVLIVVFIAIIPTLWILGMVDAYRSANKINEKISVE